MNTWWKVKVLGYTEDGQFTGGVFDIEAEDPTDAHTFAIEAGWDCGWNTVEAHVMRTA